MSDTMPSANQGSVPSSRNPAGQNSPGPSSPPQNATTQNPTGPRSGSQSPSNGDFSSARMRGAVDLSALSNVGSVGSGSGTAGEFVVEVNEKSFPEIVQLSTEVPVIFALYAGYSPQSQTMVETLERLVGAYVGRLLLAKADVEVFPQLAQAFGVQGVPAAVAVVKGQPVPLFNGTVSDSDAKRYLEELLTVAAQNGVTGTLGDADAQPQEAPLPPLHQAALDAIDSGDYDAAASAYQQALAEQPADREAKVGLAQVGLLQRTSSLTQEQGESIRDEAASSPDDVHAQLAAADLDMAGGHVEDSLNRLVAFIAGHPGGDAELAQDRETARLRLLELFEVVGASDPRVAKARQALARALF